MGARERVERLMNDQVLVLREGDTVIVNVGGDIVEGTVSREEIVEIVSGRSEWALVVQV